MMRSKVRTKDLYLLDVTIKNVGTTTCIPAGLCCSCGIL